MNLDINKPVFILAHGKSVHNVGTWMPEYQSLDVYWASFNRFPITAKIIEPYDKIINIVYSMNVHRLRQTVTDVKKFLKAGGERLFMVNVQCHDKDIFRFDMEHHMQKEFEFLTKEHPTKIIHTKYCLNNGSMPHFIMGLLEVGFRKICLFGYDGSLDDRSQLEHYEQSFYECDPVEEMYPLMDDCKKMNEHGKEMFSGYPDAEINNCNLESVVKCFPRIDYKHVMGIYTTKGRK